MVNNLLYMSLDDNIAGFSLDGTSANVELVVDTSGDGARIDYPMDLIILDGSTLLVTEMREDKWDLLTLSQSLQLQIPSNFRSFFRLLLVNIDTGNVAPLCTGVTSDNMSDCRLDEPIGLEFDGESIFVTSQFSVTKIAGSSTVVTCF